MPQDSSSYESLTNNATNRIRGSYQRYVDNTSDIMGGLIDSLDDNSIISAAMERSGKLGERTTAENKRTSARYGMGQSEIQRQAFERMSKLNNSKNTVDIANTARGAQREQNDAVSLQLANIGASERNAGSGRLDGALGLAGNRDRANRQARANSRSANMSTGVGALALLAM